MGTGKISFEDWLQENGLVWNHLREKEKREAVLKWKAQHTS